ncbi:hypothetical protein SBRCBS47491_009875 [Sporothrix bragantina]|uniref:Uncharacterized protein n=1 Tax=Sporothrix bragantina TaxID=671064 RepID=A0ABP0CYE2_9PEZI
MRADNEAPGGPVGYDEGHRRAKDIDTFYRIIMEATFRRGHAGLYNGRVDVSGGGFAGASRLTGRLGQLVTDVPRLSTFMHSWGKAFYEDQRSAYASNRLRLRCYKVEVVRQWEALVSINRDERASLLRAMAPDGLTPVRRRGVNDHTLLIRFMAQAFGLKDTKTFSNNMYTWRPLVDFTDCFGRGVLALLPAGIERRAAAMARRFRVASQSQHAIGLPWLLEELKRRHPYLYEQCKAADTVLVSPLLTTGHIADTEAARLYALNLASAV